MNQIVLGHAWSLMMKDYKTSGELVCGLDLFISIALGTRNVVVNVGEAGRVKLERLRAYFHEQ